MSISRFNVRVYALIINELEEVLLSDEFRFGHHFTKFPGGGVEFGEGLKDALFRELKEELNLEISEAQLFYINDFFQQSAFREEDQVLAFYYIVHLKKNKLSLLEYHLPLQTEGEKQRWKHISQLDNNELTFPIDQVVAEKLYEGFCGIHSYL
jgi:ADP-ribose pyrophosphatase YjhB (NUDIX family)